MTTTAVVRLQRTIPAPPERVYRAWLDPDVLRRWFAAGSFTAGRVAVDERVGGRHSTFQLDHDGRPAGGFEAEILELVPAERIVFRWFFVGPDRALEPQVESRLTVTFAPDPAGTALTLLHERLDGFARLVPEVADKVEPGWARALDRLAGLHI